MTPRSEQALDGHRQALRTFFLTAGVVLLLLCIALKAANIAPAAATPMFTPMVGMMIVAGGVAGFTINTWRDLLRTDEHDRAANLWSLSLSWLAIMVITPAWWLLAHSAVLPPVDGLTAYLISAGVGAVVWTWLRFR
ncbi:hypothetical protein BH10PSE12_BH10PSE12_30140 [soil metagenome]